MNTVGFYRSGRQYPLDLRKIAQRIIHVKQLVAGAVLVDKFSLYIVVVVFNAVHGLADAKSVGIVGVADVRSVLAVAFQLSVKLGH